MTQNTRQFPRYEIRVSAEVTPQIGPGFTCVTRDLSAGGLGLECDRPLAEGSAVDLELFVVVDDIEDEGTQTLKALGKVIWCRVKDERIYLAGIEFLDLDEQRTDHVQKLVAAISKQG